MIAAMGCSGNLPEECRHLWRAKENVRHRHQCEPFGIALPCSMVLSPLQLHPLHMLVPILARNPSHCITFKTSGFMHPVMPRNMQELPVIPR